MQEKTQQQLLDDWFEPATLRRGRAYFSQGAVLDYVCCHDRIEGRVKASFDGYYETEVSGVWANGLLTRIETECSCPVGYQCKHGVALTLTWIASQNSDSGELSPPLVRWLRDIEGATKPGDDQHYQLAADVVYILDVRAVLGAPSLICESHLVKRLKSGAWGKRSQRLMPHTVIREQVSDSAYRLRGLVDHATGYSGELTSSRAGELLIELLETGNCYWQDYQSQPLSLGPQRCPSSRHSVRRLASGGPDLRKAPIHGEAAFQRPPGCIRLVPLPAI